MLRDRILVPADINEGVWVNIGMIVNTPKDRMEAEEYYHELRQMNEDMKYKYLYDDERVAGIKKNLPMLKKEGRTADYARESSNVKRIDEIKDISLK